MTMPRLPRRPALAALLLAGLPLACARQQEAAEKVPPAPVQAVGPLGHFFEQWTNLNGTTQPLPQHAARISATIEGQVLRVLADADGKPLLGPDGKPLAEGGQVSAGQLVVQLNDKLARANYEKSRASQKDLDEQVQQADTTVQLAQAELTRLQGLMTSRPITGGEFPLVSAVDVEKARKALDIAQSQQRGAVARREAAAKDLAAQEVQLNLYALKAPITGRLGLLQVGPGQTLSVGTSVADVIDLDDIDVLCHVPPADAGLMAVADTSKREKDRLGLARLVVEDRTGKLVPVVGLTGNVVFVGESADPASGNFPVKLRFPNKDHRLRANAVVRAQVQTQPRIWRISVKDTALLEDEQPPVVVVVEELKDSTNDEGKPIQLGKAHRLQAEVGVRDRENGEAEILSLTDPVKKQKVLVKNALFVVKGAHGLRDGDDVVLQTEAED
jgi:RND family efflux transporter MFP subunit